MFTKEISLHQATQENLKEIAQALNTFIVHQHLDWQSLTDQLNTGSIFLCRSGTELIGLISISGNTPDGQWIKLFGVRKESQKYLVFRHLLPFAIDHLDCTSLFTIAFWDWYKRLINTTNEFSTFETIVSLEAHISKSDYASVHNVSQITDNQVEELHKIDTESFSPPWQLSRNNFGTAIKQSNFAKTIIAHGKPIGYILAEYDNFIAHLSRIAIHPVYQGKGIAASLMNDLFNTLGQEKIQTVTVNTQESNIRSLHLYEKYGFFLTGEKIPVFRYNQRQPGGISHDIKKRP